MDFEDIRSELDQLRALERQTAGPRARRAALGRILSTLASPTHNELMLVFNSNPAWAAHADEILEGFPQVNSLLVVQGGAMRWAKELPSRLMAQINQYVIDNGPKLQGTTRTRA